MIKRLGSRAGRILGWLMTAGGTAIFVGFLGGLAVLGWLLGTVVGLHPLLAVAILLLIFLPLLVVFGLLPVALGGVFLYASDRAKQEAIRDCFFRLLQTNQGRMTLLEFSQKAELEPQIARTYLDRWARDCNADFEVTIAGDVQYVFPLTAELPEASSQVWPVWLQDRLRSLQQNP